MIKSALFSLLTVVGLIPMAGEARTRVGISFNHTEMCPPPCVYYAPAYPVMAPTPVYMVPQPMPMAYYQPVVPVVAYPMPVPVMMPRPVMRGISFSFGFGR